jgi:hypothetical protein
MLPLPTMAVSSYAIVLKLDDNTHLSLPDYITNIP